MELCMVLFLETPCSMSLQIKPNIKSRVNLGHSFHQTGLVSYLDKRLLHPYNTRSNGARCNPIPIKTRQESGAVSPQGSPA